MKKITALFLWIILLIPSFLLAQQTKAFVGAKIIPISGSSIDNGTLVIKNKKILTVGQKGEVEIPSGAKKYNVSGKVIMPGLVDSHSHIGGGSGGDQSAALNPDVRILDSINPRSDSFDKALAGGITTVNVMPGSGHLMSGRTAYLKLRDTNNIEDMLFVDDPTSQVAGGVKMANGTNPIGEPPFPGTRAKSAAKVRGLFTKAQAYKKKVEAADGDSEKMPSRDLGMETLMQVLNGNRIVHNHTHRHDDILTAIRLSKEFGYRLVLHHVSEAWKVIDEIADANVACSIIVLDAPGGKMEASEIKYKNGALLEDANITIGYHTDAPITDPRLFIRSAAFGVRAGMSRKAALKAVTLANAKMLDLEDQVGSLKKGKDADFLVLSGDPLSAYTQVQQTWIEGQKRFDITNPEDRKFSTGGYDAFQNLQQNSNHARH